MWRRPMTGCGSRRSEVEPGAATRRPATFARASTAISSIIYIMRIDDESFAVCRAGFSARIAKRLKELRFRRPTCRWAQAGAMALPAPARSRARRARLRRRRGSHWRRASAWAHRRPASWKRSARPFRAARRFPPRRQRRWRRSNSAASAAPSAAARAIGATAHFENRPVMPRTPTSGVHAVETAWRASGSAGRHSTRGARRESPASNRPHIP